MTAIAGNGEGVQPTYTPLPTQTPYPPQTAPVSVVTQAPKVETATPNAVEQDPPPGSIVPQGTVYERSGISMYNLKKISASDVEICVGALVIENNKGIDFVLRYKLDVIHLSDNTGRNYAQRNTNDMPSGQTTIAPGQSETIKMGGYSDRLCFGGTVPLEAKYVILTVDELAGLKNLNWKIDLE